MIPFVMNDDGRRRHQEVLCGAVQEALVSAARQAIGPLRHLRVVTNQNTGDLQVLAKFLVVEKVADKYGEISCLDASRINPLVKIGEPLEVDVTPIHFVRVAALHARNVLVEEIRRAKERL